jgi:hypothetical protein
MKPVDKIKEGLTEALAFARGTKPLTNVIIKDGKVIRKKTYRAKQKKLAADRETKAWLKMMMKPKRQG